MENPNANCVRLRRHHSMQSTLRHRASVLQGRLESKSNPYVGSFRHAPPVSTLSKKLPSRVDSGGTTENVRWWNSTGLKLRVPITLPMKSSAYIGWFRHSPPTRLCCHNDMKRHVLRREDQKVELAGCLQLARRQDLTVADLILCGRLKGGGTEKSTDLYQQQHSNLQQIWLEAAAHGVVYAFRIVARLASGFAYDVESMNYIPDGGKASSSSQARLRQQGTPCNNDDASDENCSQDSDDSSCGDANSFETSLSVPAVLDLPMDLDLSGIDIPADLELSVSSMAEAYYAHQAAKDLDLMSHCSYLGTEQTGQYGNHRLDYVITQLDIARMARNASRHLDVESIYNLPTTTYQSKKLAGSHSKKTSAPPLQIGNDATEGFSWLIIPAETRADADDSSEDCSISAEANHEGDDDEEDVCVICFEHFCDGDRLRVLPCQHSFHMGCIDRWLSGSHSPLDCVTSGCPTCKKRPNVGGYPEYNATLDGSVPAWAFAQIGESLAGGIAKNMHV